MIVLGVSSKCTAMANITGHVHWSSFASTLLRLCSLLFFLLFFIGFVRDFNQILNTTSRLLFASLAGRADGVEKAIVVNLGLQLRCGCNILDK